MSDSGEKSSGVVGTFPLMPDRYCPICGANKPYELHELWCPNEPDRLTQADPEFWRGEGDECACCACCHCTTCSNARADAAGNEEWTAEYPPMYYMAPEPPHEDFGVNQPTPAYTYPEDGETRIVDPVTGGAKGSKLAQLGAVDPLALLEVAKVAGYGGEKYERYNFVKGYRYSLSYDALQRHLLAFWGGENTDPESRLPHLAHAAWHCLALLTFSLRGLGTDNRFPQ